MDVRGSCPCAGERYRRVGGDTACVHGPDQEGSPIPMTELDGASTASYDDTWGHFTVDDAVRVTAECGAFPSSTTSCARPGASPRCR